MVSTHLSSAVSSDGRDSSRESASGRFIRMNRAAFHSLLAKLREEVTFSSLKRISLPRLMPPAMYSSAPNRLTSARDKLLMKLTPGPVELEKASAS